MAGYSALGALAPDIVLAYSKRFTMPHLTFSPGQYIAVTIIYAGLAAAVALAYPYRGRPTAYKAFGIGVALPLIISTLASVANTQSVIPRGTTLPGQLLDLLAFR